MPFNQFPSATRRRALQTIATAGVIGITGCTSNNDESTEAPPTTSPPVESPQTTETRPTPTTTTETAQPPDQPATPQPIPSPGPADDWEEPPADPWGSITPTGRPEDTDDPNWRYLGHDLGNTFHNPHAEGPDSYPTVRWTFDGKGGYWDRHDIYHPLIVDGTVYSVRKREDGKGELVAIDAETGTTDSRIQTEQYLYHPMIADGTVYAAVGGSIAAFDVESGEEYWRTDSLLRPNSIRYADGTVVASSGQRLVGVAGATGDVQWSKETKLDHRSTNSWLPVIADQTLIVPAQDPLRKLSSGEPRMKRPGPLSYPLLTDGILYGMNGKGVMAVSWSDLTPLWGHSNTSDQTFMGGFFGRSEDVVIKQTRVEDGSGKRVAHGYNQDSGAKQWTAPLGKLSPFITATTPTTAFTVGLSDLVVAIDLATGTVKWQFELPGDTSLGCGAALADDLLVVTDGSGKVWALE